MPLFSSKPQDALTLMIEVQSALVRGTLVWNRAGTLPTIIFSRGVVIPFKAVANSEYLIRMAIHGASEAVEAALQYVSMNSTKAGAEPLPKRISSVHYVLSSPWIISQAKMLTAVFAHATAVTRNLVMGMVRTERDKFIPNSADKFSVVEEKIFDVRLNGYSIAEWEGKSAAEIGVSYVMSIGGTEMMDKLRQVCANAVPLSHVKFHSAMLLEHIGIEKCVPGLSSYLLINVHGELTDAVVVERDASVFFGSYPFGVYSVLRKLSQSLRVGDDSADSLLTLAMKNELDATHNRNVTSIISGLQTEWSDQFSKLFKSGSYIAQLPRVAFISGSAQREFFKRSFVSAYPLISLKNLEIDDISNYVNYASHGEDRNIMTGLEAVAIHSMEK